MDDVGFSEMAVPEFREKMERLVSQLETIEMSEQKEQILQRAFEMVMDVEIEKKQEAQDRAKCAELKDLRSRGPHDSRAVKYQEQIYRVLSQLVQEMHLQIIRRARTMILMQSPSLYYMEIVRENGHNLRDVPKEHRTREVCLAAVENNGLALQYVPREIQDREIHETAVTQSGLALRYVPGEMRDIELIRMAVEKDSTALQFVRYQELPPDILLTAVERNPFVLEFIPRRCQTLEIWTCACSQSLSLLDFVPVQFHGAIYQGIYTMIQENRPVSPIVRYLVLMVVEKKTETTDAA